MLWSTSFLSEILNLSVDLLKNFKSFQFDSRKISPGDIYVAIKGEKVDGHDFVSQAYQRGAIGAIVEKKTTFNSAHFFQIQVRSTVDYLQFCAEQLIKKWNPKVIAVTGSIGKTSCKEFIYTLTCKDLDIYKTPGNYNTQITVPLTILNAPKATEYLLLEMGLSQPNQIQRLLKIAPPKYAILTYLAHVHIEAFESFKHLALEKAKIFSCEETEIGLCSLEMPFSECIIKESRAPKKTFSMKFPEADFFLKQEKEHLSFYTKGQLSLVFKAPIKDTKSLFNLGYAMGIAHLLGLSWSQIQKRIPDITYPEKRMVLKEHKGIQFLDDAYNACVESVENALKAMPKVKGRKIAVLSEMVEQGNFTQQNHQQIAQIALQHADLLIGYGEEMKEMIPIWRNSGKKWAFFLSYPHLFSYLSNCVMPGDAVLIKGARKHALERLVNDFVDH